MVKQLQLSTTVLIRLAFVDQAPFLECRSAHVLNGGATAGTFRLDNHNFPAWQPRS